MNIIHHNMSLANALHDALVRPHHERTNERSRSNDGGHHFGGSLVAAVDRRSQAQCCCLSLSKRTAALRTHIMIANLRSRTHDDRRIEPRNGVNICRVGTSKGHVVNGCDWRMCLSALLRMRVSHDEQHEKKRNELGAAVIRVGEPDPLVDVEPTCAGSTSANSRIHRELRESNHNRNRISWNDCRYTVLNDSLFSHTNTFVCVRCRSITQRHRTGASTLGVA
jgi:hypothetical protein